MANKTENSNQTQKLIETIVYITRIDNPFIYYEQYLPAHSPLEILKADSTESTALDNEFEKAVTTKELVQILNKLLELQISGIMVESKRVPLISSEFKFKGYRQVEYSYRDTKGLRVITVTHKRKEIIIKAAQERDKRGN